MIHPTYYNQNDVTHVLEILNQELDIQEQAIASGGRTPLQGGLKPPESHCAFLSNHHTGYIAYYPTQRSLERRVHERMRIGKYIRKYWPELNDAEIQNLTSINLIAQDQFRLYIATELEECQKLVQESHADGVSTCMTHEAEYYSLEYNPLDVLLGDDSFGYAVVRDSKKDGAIVARAIVNVEKKTYPMVYGRWEVIHELLEKEGFTHDSFDGSVLCVEFHGRDIILPYIDAKRSLDRSHHRAQRFDFDEETMTVTLCQNGAYIAEGTSGRHRVYTHLCVCCGERLRESEVSFYDRYRDPVGECCESEYSEVLDAYGDTVYAYRGGSIIEAEDGSLFLDYHAACHNDYRRCRITGDWYPKSDLVHNEKAGDWEHPTAA
jgi:hypothetical protein